MLFDDLMIFDDLLKYFSSFLNYFVFYFDNFIGHHDVTLMVFSFLSSFIVCLIILLSNRLSQFNISHNILYDKELTHHEKVMFDKPDNFILFIRMGSYFLSKVVISLAFIFLLSFLISGVVFYLVFLIPRPELYSYVLQKIIILLFSVTVGTVTSILIYYLFIRLKITQKEINRSKQSMKEHHDFSEISDIRDVKEAIAKISHEEYNPVNMFEPDKIIFGINEDHQKNFIMKDEFNKTHILLLGKSGSGKGKVIASIARQLIQNHDEILVIFDPKIDNWLFNVIRDYSDENLYCIDLNEPVKQINPFKNINTNDFLEVVSPTFDLEFSNNSGVDAYRSQERIAVTKIAYKSLTKDFDINEFDKRLSLIMKELKEEKNNLTIQSLKNRVAELSYLPAIGASDGLDLEEIFTGKCTLFIRGSLKNETIGYAQKLLLNRILTILEKRKDNSLHATIVLDEFPKFISKSLLNSITTVRDKNMNFIFAHTSFGDFSGYEIDRRSIEANILTNTGVKLIFNTDDVETAKKLSDMTGSIKFKRNQEEMDLAENYGMVKQKKLRQIDDFKNFIHYSIFSNLPASTSIFLSNQLPAINLIGTIKAQKYDFTIYSGKYESDDDNDDDEKTIRKNLGDFLND